MSGSKGLSRPKRARYGNVLEDPDSVRLRGHLENDDLVPVDLFQKLGQRRGVLDDLVVAHGDPLSGKFRKTLGEPLLGRDCVVERFVHKSKCRRSPSANRAESETT